MKNSAQYYTLSLILMMACSFTFAQPNAMPRFQIVTKYMAPEEAWPYYLLGDEVSLRECPSDTCPLVGVMDIGTRLTLLEMSDSSMTRKGIESRWYRVDVKEGSGWVWGGYIAQQAFGCQSDPDIKFLSGYEKVVAVDGGFSNGQYYQIRAIKKGKQVAKIVLRSFAWELGGVMNIGPQGLDNLDDILILTVPCNGGCGCTTGDIMVFWNNGKFTHVMDLVGSPDAEYSTGEEFIYPTHMEGEKDVVIKKIYSYVETPYGHSRGDSLERHITEEYYKWDGQSLYQLDRDPEVTSYFLEVH